VRTTLERELKLDVDGPFALPELPGSPLPERTFTSTYHDTPTRSLGRAGITLRRRVENGTSLWQLKLPHGSESARTELEEPGGPSGPPPDLARLLVAHIRHGRLEPVATMRTHRSGVRIEEDGRTVADVTVDEVSILYAEQDVSGFTELEVELVDDGDEPDLRRLGKLLLDAGAHKSSGAPKLMRVLELPPSTAPPADDAPLHEHLRYAFEEQLAALEAHDPGVRLGSDPEDLHQLRVATRRARALMRTTRPLLGDRLAALGGELKLFGALLGAVRDLDVLLDRLRAGVADLDVDRAAGEALLATLEGERGVHRGVLVEAMETQRYAALLDALRTAIDDLGPLDGETAPADIAKKALRKLRGDAEAMTDEPPDDELHELRIKAKRARYAAELVALGGSKSARRAVKAFKELQDVLGEHQDAVIAEDHLRRFAGPETAVAAGRLIERERRRKEEMRARYPGVLRVALRRGRKAFA
jgi:CHAD domain-containing protein